MQNLNSLSRANDPERLYIFVTSWQPDPYVNVLAHVLHQFASLSKVYFVSIVEYDYVEEGDPKEARQSLDVIRAGVESRLRELSESRYTRRPKPDGASDVVKIDSADAAIYKNCRSVLESLE